MRYIVSAADGRILKTVFVSNDDHALSQVGPDGATLHLLPQEAGMVDDSRLVVSPDHVLVDREPGAATQHAGMRVLPVFPPAPWS